MRSVLSVVFPCFIILLSPRLLSFAIKDELQHDFQITPQQINLKMMEKKTMQFVFLPTTMRRNNSHGKWRELERFTPKSQDENVLRIIEYNIERAQSIDDDSWQWNGNCTLEGVFIGRTDILASVITEEGREEELLLANVIVTRREGQFDVWFKMIVVGFVTILYINFGAALDLIVLKRILLKPIGAAIGFVSQFLIMPLLSFIIGYILFPNRIDLRLGLFFIGCTPGGGGSNLFTVILSANLNLSIAMTTISNLVAFMMMPLWIFTLGAVIFRDGNLTVPYRTIVTMSCSLLIPLLIGVSLQKCAPKVATILKKLLRPFAFVMIIVITVFGFTANTFLMRLFTWKIILATSALPWFGYIFGFLMARFCCFQSPIDSLTIAIETGIQNMGIAMFMLNFSLPQPLADLTSVVPVANILLTPLPLFGLYFLQKLSSILRPDVEGKNTTDNPN